MLIALLDVYPRRRLIGARTGAVPAATRHVWTTPRTWVPGELVTALMLNQHLRDNLNVLKTSINDDGSLKIASFPPADPTFISRWRDVVRL